jgi:hypothetical protein
MDNHWGSLITFTLAAFALAAVLIIKKDTLPLRAKRPLAIIALIMVSFAFFLIVYSLFTL